MKGYDVDSDPAYASTPHTPKDDVVAKALRGPKRDEESASTDNPYVAPADIRPGGGATPLSFRRVSAAGATTKLSVPVAASATGADGGSGSGADADDDSHSDGEGGVKLTLRRSSVSSPRSPVYVFMLLPLNTVCSVGIRYLARLL
jgi:hypothetical protein